MRRKQLSGFALQNATERERAYVCPKLNLSQFLDYDIAEERRDAAQMSQLWLRRCRMVVVCGSEIRGTMLTEISTAERLKLICTTLEGLEKIIGTDDNRSS